MYRRRFLQLGVALPLSLAAAPAWRVSAAASVEAAPQARLFCVSQGKTALLNADGTGFRVLDFDVPNQATWQPCGFFADGRRVLMLSMEPRRDGPGKPFEEYYTQTPTHIWVHDLDTGSLHEVATQDRMAVFYTPALLLGDDRMLVQVVRDKVGQIFSMALDGSDARPFTQPGEGLPYGLSLSSDGKRVAFHLASPEGYQVYTSDHSGGNRVRLAADPAHLYFGTSWSPDGEWVLYVDCHYGADPGHDWADVCIGRADGSEHRVLTEGQAMWFAATYGPLEQRGGGSNLPAWTRDGQVLFPRRSPDAKVAWEYRTGQPDLDHFNRDYKPESARGGTAICKLHPGTGAVTWVTQPTEGVWDFRASESPDGKHVVFCRARTGSVPSLWVVDTGTGKERMISEGIDGKGVDHPRWLPMAGA
jgi:Tol biopolymer transport system component